MAVFVSGCQPVQQVDGLPAPAADLPQPTATEATEAAQAPAKSISEPLLPASDVQETATETDDAQAAVEALVPRAPVPAHLTIADAGVDVVVEAMGWEVSRTGGVASTRWLLPANTAGWHVTSARAGAVGNVIISGRQLGAEAVFTPLALGAVSVGQKVLLEDDTGAGFTYTVREVSQPLPILGADASADAAVAAYMAATDDPILTLITGWPDFTTTHRLFVVATLDK